MQINANLSDNINKEQLSYGTLFYGGTVNPKVLTARHGLKSVQLFIIKRLNRSDQLGI